MFEESCLRYDDRSKMYAHDIFYRGSKNQPERFWSDEAVKVLSNENNKYDVCMEISVDASDIYFNQAKNPFGYEMSCDVHFTMIDDNTTKVEIRVLSSKIHVRDRLLPSPPHFVNNPVYKKVKPTTIEEYRCLQFLGNYLGVADQMPSLKL